MLKDLLEYVMLFGLVIFNQSNLPFQNLKFFNFFFNFFSIFYENVQKELMSEILKSIRIYNTIGMLMNEIGIGIWCGILIGLEDFGNFGITIIYWIGLIDFNLIRRWNNKIALNEEMTNGENCM
jgi:hypothetical protein